MAKRAMKRTFRDRGGLDWSYWRRVARRLKRKSANDMEEASLFALATDDGSILSDDNDQMMETY
jgi:hypothetical protein